MVDETGLRPPGLDATDGAPSSDGHSLMAGLSRAMVGIYKEQFGRGPVRAHSHWAGDDMIVCVLEQSLTPAELNLREMGAHTQLRNTRMLFQYATTKDFVEPVERLTGRTVKSFISGMDTDQDTAIEAFLLYPPGEEGRSRAEEPAV